MGKVEFTGYKFFVENIDFHGEYRFMSKVELFGDEEILSRDVALHHRGMLAVHVEVLITNFRLLVQPNSTIEKLLSSEGLLLFFLIQLRT